MTIVSPPSPEECVLSPTAPALVSRLLRALLLSAFLLGVQLLGVQLLGVQLLPVLGAFQAAEPATAPDAAALSAGGVLGRGRPGAHA